MGYLDCKDLPAFGSVVFCKWPQEPTGNSARRVVVIDSEVRSNEFLTAGVVRIVYGTGNFERVEATEYDVVISTPEEARLCGLAKPTRFYICKAYIKTVMWKDDRFVSPGYIKGQGRVPGRFTPERCRELQAKVTAFDLSLMPVGT